MADLEAARLVEEGEHHVELTMVELVMAPGIAMMYCVVAVLPNSEDRGCLFDWRRWRVTMSPPRLMFDGCRFPPAFDSLGS